jgi:hypothetical protein
MVSTSSIKNTYPNCYFRIFILKASIAIKKLQIVLQAYGKKISMPVYRQIEQTIQYTESQSATLPVPDITDK